jgi:hypothetical protein
LVASSLSFLSAAKSSTEKKNPGTKFQQCPLLNISYCPASEARLLSGKSLVVVVYNSLGWKREEVVRVPVSIFLSTWLTSVVLTLSLFVIQYYLPNLPDNFFRCRLKMLL